MTRRICVSISDGWYDTAAYLIALAKRRAPETGLGFLTTPVTPELTRSIRYIGGVACLSRRRDLASITAAVRTVLAGGTVFDDGLAPIDNRMSARRRTILGLAADGLADKQISHRLGVTESTIRDHWGHIFGQLGATNRTEAVAKACRLDLI